MSKQYELADIVVVGRTLGEYCKMFSLDKHLLKREIILDVAAGVSSFCAEANAKGYTVTATDRIYGFSASEIEKRYRQDIELVIERLQHLSPPLVSDFKDMGALRIQREKAFQSFIQDFKKHGTKRYVTVEYPTTNFKDNHFTLSLVSNFLFLYEDRLDYEFHKKTILELLQVTSKEIRIFPTLDLTGKNSTVLDSLMKDDHLKKFQMTLQKVDYPEFMKGRNQMLTIRKNL